MKFLFFDIECANCFGGVGKIFSFGYVLTDETFHVLERDDILMNPEWRKQAGEQSEKIAESFDKEHFVESVEDIYEEIME